MNFEKDPTDKTRFEILGYDYDDADPTVMREKIDYLRNKPYLFSGTVRLNIDPEVEHTDDEICRVLHLLGGQKILDEIIQINQSAPVEGIQEQRDAQMAMMFVHKLEMTVQEHKMESLKKKETELIKMKL